MLRVKIGLGFGATIHEIGSGGKGNPDRAWLKTEDNLRQPVLKVADPEIISNYVASAN